MSDRARSGPLQLVQVTICCAVRDMVVVVVARVLRTRFFFNRSEGQIG
jgi:hypothetical protein